MRYFKPCFIILVLLLFSQICYAEQWEVLVRENTRYISIDIDSVNYHNNSLYYNVYYNVLKSIYNNTLRDKKYVTVQSKGNSVGIVNTSEYKGNLNALTPQVAKNFKELTKDSLLYEANIRAQEVYEWSKLDINDMPYFKTYMRDVQNRIKMKWNPPKRENPKQAVIQFKIAKNGMLIGYNFIQSSGDKEFDYVALKTLKETSFAPLPERFRGANVDIQYTFDYNPTNSYDKIDARKVINGVGTTLKLINSFR